MIWPVSENRCRYFQKPSDAAWTSWHHFAKHRFSFFFFSFKHTYHVQDEMFLLIKNTTTTPNNTFFIGEHKDQIISRCVSLSVGARFLMFVYYPRNAKHLLFFLFIMTARVVKRYLCKASACLSRRLSALCYRFSLSETKTWIIKSHGCDYRCLSD